jgi:hypothetical protein
MAKLDVIWHYSGLKASNFFTRAGSTFETFLQPIRVSCQLFP